MAMNGSGNHDRAYATADESVIGLAQGEARVVLLTQLAHALGLAMQNVVAQQQTMHTINNAIAAKALSMLAEDKPAEAINIIREREQAENEDIAKTLKALADVIHGAPPPAPPVPSGSG